MWTVVFAIRLLRKPGETEPDHPKLLVLKNDR
jgi:hypothetical protein